MQLTFLQLKDCGGRTPFELNSPFGELSFLSFVLGV